MGNKKDEKNFKFWFPAEISKAKGKDGKTKMVLGGIASTIDTDTDGENLVTKGFDINPLKQFGLVNWHHGAKTNPETIIGEPSVAELRKGGLYVEAELYKDSVMAKNVYDLAKVMEKNSKTRRLGFSIEGRAIERDPMNEKRITKAAITGVAITHMPKNIHTLAEIIKGETIDYSEDEEENNTIDVEELNKALENELLEAKCALADQIIKGDVGEDEDDTQKSLSTDSTSGKAVAKEHVDGQLKNQTSASKLTEKEKIVKAEIYDKIFSSFPDIDISKAKKVYLIIQKVSEMKNVKTPTDEDITKAMNHLGIELNSEEGDDVTKANATDEASETEDIIDKGEKANELEKSEDGKEIVKGKPMAPVNSDPTEDDGDGKTKKVDKKPDGDNTPAKTSKGSVEKSYMKKGDHYVEMHIENGELVQNGELEYLKKGEDFIALGEAEMQRSEITKAISEGFGVIETKQNEISKAMGTVLMKFNEENEEFQKGVNDRLEAIEKGTPGRKSFPNAKAAEKTFNKSAEEDISGANNGEAKDPNTISVSGNRGLVGTVLEKAMYAPAEKGGGLDPVFEKALTVFEASGNVEAVTIKELKAKFGISLVA